MYKGHLVLWDHENVVHYIALKDVRRQISKWVHPNVAVAMDLLIFRTDWKKSEQFASLSRAYGVIDSIFKYDSLTSECSFQYNYQGSLGNDRAQADGYIVDVEIYGDEIYFATDSGLYQSLFDPIGRNVAGFEIDSNPTLNVTAYAGQLVASQEDAGLKTRFTHLEETNLATAKMKLIDDYSLRADHIGYNILNYTGSSMPHYLRAEIADVGDSNNRKITGFGRPRPLASMVRASVMSGQGAQLSDSNLSGVAEEQEGLQIVGNSSHSLLVSNSGHLSVLHMTTSDDKPVTVKPDNKWTLDGARDDLDMLTTHDLRSGFVTEGMYDIGLITKNGVYPRIVDGPVIRARTFPKAKQYDDCLVIVNESSALLVGFIELSNQQNAF